MKTLIFLFFSIPILVHAQDFQPIIAKSNIGTISLNENYIHFEFRYVQRIKLIQINPNCVDLFAWKWISNNSEFWFFQDYQDIFLARGTIGGQSYKSYKIYSYEYHEIKE